MALKLATWNLKLPVALSCHLAMRLSADRMQAALHFSHFI